MTITGPDHALDQARRAMARADLGRLDYVRALQEAVQLGLQQRDIARALHVTQSAISQALTKAESKGIKAIPEGFSGASPYEIAERYAAGDIERDEMIRQLSAWPYVQTPDHAEQLAMEWKAILPPDPPGTFEEVGEAFDKGLIDGEAYDIILEASSDIPVEP
jgi:transcriptional regulator with XRE-family HTH domain